MKMEIENAVQQILNSPFETEECDDVPRIGDKRLIGGNKGLKFEATVLYILIKNLDEILSKNNPIMVAKFRSVYFYLVIEIVHDLGGSVRRITENGFYIFFQGTTQDSLNNAVKSALKIKYMLTNEYSKVRKSLEIYEVLNFAIGIDDGEVLCVGFNSEHTRQKELVWSGTPLNTSMNIAQQLKVPQHVGISALVHFNLKDNLKYTKSKDKSNTAKEEIWHENYFDLVVEKHKYYSTSFFWTVS